MTFKFWLMNDLVFNLLNYIGFFLDYLGLLNLDFFFSFLCRQIFDRSIGDELWSLADRSDSFHDGIGVAVVDDGAVFLLELDHH